MLAQQALAISSASKDFFLNHYSTQCRGNNIPEVALKGVVNEEGTAAADEDNLHPSSKGKSDGREM